MATILPAALLKKAAQHITPGLEGLVPGDGSLTPRFILVGEAPGETEVTSQKPFTGRAGQELDRSLTALGVTRQDVYLTSALHSRPYRVVTKRSKRTQQTYQKKDNRPPNQRELKQQAFLLDYELAHLPCDLLMTIGNVGLQRLLGADKKVGQYHGQLLQGPVRCWSEIDHTYHWTAKQFRVLPTFHPAAVFYNRKLASDLAADLEKFKWLLADEGN